MKNGFWKAPDKAFIHTVALARCLGEVRPTRNRLNGNNILATPSELVVAAERRKFCSPRREPWVAVGLEASRGAAEHAVSPLWGLHP